MNAYSISSIKFKLTNRSY